MESFGEIRGEVSNDGFDEGDQPWSVAKDTSSTRRVHDELDKPVRVAIVKSFKIAAIIGVCKRYFGFKSKSKPKIWKPWKSKTETEPEKLNTQIEKSICFQFYEGY